MKILSPPLMMVITMVMMMLSAGGGGEDDHDDDKGVVISLRSINYSESFFIVIFRLPLKARRSLAGGV